MSEGGTEVGELAGAARGLLGSVAGALVRRVTDRIPTADLDERDPDYIRDNLAGLWLLASFYFRADVRGLRNIPAEGPVLLVGNHSGGNITPDTLVFTLASSAFFGAERRFHQLVHNLVLAMPSPVPLRKYGSVAASHENSKLALRKGAALLVYPGVFISRGERLAKLTGIDRMFRLKVLPISLAIPWGLNVGDMATHFPLPAKITIEALEPIDLRQRFGPEPDVDEVYEAVTATMQAKLSELQAERRFPILG